MVKGDAFKKRLDDLFQDIQVQERTILNPITQDVVKAGEPANWEDPLQGELQPGQLRAWNEVDSLIKESLLPVLQTTEVTEKTTVGSLRLQNFRVSANSKSSQVDNAFRDNPELVGVIVKEDNHRPRIISRVKYYEMLGKQFGVAIFMQRPIYTMLTILKTGTLVVPTTNRIDETVKLALERPPDEVFEPILIAFPQDEYFLLDIYILFQAQMKLLINLQQQIQMDNLKLEKRVELRTSQLLKANSNLEEEIVERRRAQEKLDVRLEYERTLTLCANALLTGGDSHEVIQETMARLINAVGVSRVFILENTDADELGLCLRLRNQAFAEGVKPIPRRLKIFPQKIFGEWLNYLWQGNRIIEHIDTAHEKEQGLMKNLGLSSILLIPIGEPDNWIGVIGFGETQIKRVWDENDIELLKTVAQMLYSYFLRQRNEFELANAHNEAMKASQFKSELLAKVSHELRTPLSAILGYAQLLKTGSYGTLNEEQKEADEIIISSSKYLTTLVNGILDQAQLDNGQLNLLKMPFYLKNVAEEVESRVRVLAESKGLAFEVEFAPGVPEEMLGDRIRLEQILTNLLSNAIKFTDEGNVKIRFSVSGTDLLCIQISDTGSGIPENAQTQIFDKFTQVDGSPTRTHGGTGLGLSISKQLVELMEGRIKLSSELGKGSVFTVELPLISANTDSN